MVLPPSRRSLLTETAQRYALGLDQVGSYLAGRGVSRGVATGALLGRVSDPILEHNRFEGWLSLPYVTPAGVVAFKFRCLEDHDHKAGHHGKYDGPGGQKIRLYNAQVCATGGPVVLICEGELDTLVAESQLGVPAVGTWGTNWMDHHSRCFADFDRVVVVADHDEKEAVNPKTGKTEISSPGRKHATKVKDSISGADLVLPPAGMDLSEWLQQNGVDAVREALGLD